VITTFLFDIGNVVWSYKPFLNRLRHRWADLTGLSYDEFHAIYDSYYKRFEINTNTLDDFVIFLNQTDPAPFYQALDDIYNTPEFKKYLNQPILKLILNLRSAFRVGFLSNAENYFYPYQHQKFESNFDFGVMSWQIGYDKPDPQAFLKTLELQHFKPEEVVFIDDTQKNIDAARSLGIKSILFENNPQLLSELRSLNLY
jgi:HAD superfamily hydrolase (TIGR01509 family)